MSTKPRTHAAANVSAGPSASPRHTPAASGNSLLSRDATPRLCQPVPRVAHALATSAPPPSASPSAATRSAAAAAAAAAAVTAVAAAVSPAAASASKFHATGSSLSATGPRADRERPSGSASAAPVLEFVDDFLPGAGAFAANRAAFLPLAAAPAKHHHHHHHQPPPPPPARTTVDAATQSSPALSRDAAGDKRAADAATATASAAIDATAGAHATRPRSIVELLTQHPGSVEATKAMLRRAVEDMRATADAIRAVTALRRGRADAL